LSVASTAIFAARERILQKSVPDTTDLGLYNEQMIKTDILFVDGSMSFIYPTILIHRGRYNWN
jgi:hypothetical protein